MYSTSPALQIPATISQENILCLDNLLNANSIRYYPWIFQLYGKLDVYAVYQSLDAIVARHEILRTGFVEKEGELTQVIAAPEPLACPLVDLTTAYQNNLDSDILTLIQTELNKPFDITSPPLIRALLCKVSEQEQRLLVSIHPLVTDQWSIHVFWREFISLYSALSKGLSSSLSELPMQYNDYAIWQRDWLQSEDFEKQLTYWKAQLTDLTVLELSTDQPRPMQLSYRGAQETFQISAVLTQALKNLSQKYNVTLFMTLLATFQILLHRYTAQDDIVVGTTIKGRHQPELENLIGLFANTLVLRTDLSGTPSFIQLLTRVHETCLNAYAHQDIPFEKLVTELQVERDINRNPLFQVMLNFLPLEYDEIQLPGLTISQFNIPNPTTRFDLSISLVEHPDGLTGIIEYSSDLFYADTMQRLAGHFQTLLEAIVKKPEISVAEVTLLTPSERYQLLVEWNATTADFPKDKCVHQLFEAQVARTPDAIALVFKDQKLTYQALNAKANQLANYLQNAGVKPEALIAICLERSLDMVIGLLAILKAGGAYVPLETFYPLERLAFMLEDTKTQVLLTHSARVQQLPSFSGLLVCMDTLWSDLAHESTDNLPCYATPNNLAYVIYTSGSTGTPKGVEISHYNIARLLFNNHYVHFDNQQTFLFTAPIAFDASTFELWGGLLHGASCVIYPDRVPSFNNLAKIIEEERISVMLLTASLFNTVIDECPQILSSVAQILTGAEALSPRHIQQALQELPDTEIINAYGPTECTVIATCNSIPKTLAKNITSIPIGRPIANTQIYLLDKYLQPVPIGVTGEIHIGGDGLARGYLNRPDLSAEKFITHPFSDDPHARIYKTGDLARYLVDGNIEFLGRIDHQVKLRGFRIELGEIESILKTYPGINSTVVIVREDQPGDKRLIAYLTHSTLEPPKVGLLRIYLIEKLPEYMVPASFIFLDALPLTSNGKLDAKALPVPDQTDFETTNTYVSARSRTEEELVAIWEDVLNIKPIGIHDNFFNLGGHSLQILILCTKIEAKISKSVPMIWVFKYPTISQLGAKLKQDSKKVNQELDSVVTAFPIKATLPPLFWCMTLGRNPSFILKHLNAKRTFYLLNHQALDGKKAKHTCVPDMVNFYLQNVLQTNPNGPYYLFGFSFGGIIMYEVACKLCELGKNVDFLFLLDPTSIGSDERANEEYMVKISFLQKLQLKFKDKGPVYLINSFIDTVILKTSLVFGRVPRRCHERYMHKINSTAAAQQQSRSVSSGKGIANRVLVHANSRKVQDWIDVFNGNIEVHSIDANHVQLIDDPQYSVMWLDIANSAIKGLEKKPQQPS